MKEIQCDCNIIHKDIVDKVKNQMLTEEYFYKLAELFKIMGDSTRMKLLFALDKSDMCVNDIANLLNMSKSSISHQLAVLRNVGIVKYRREGKEVIYSLDDEHIKELFEVSIEHVEHKKEELNYEN